MNKKKPFSISRPEGKFTADPFPPLQMGNRGKPGRGVEEVEELLLTRPEEGAGDGMLKKIHLRKSWKEERSG